MTVLRSMARPAMARRALARLAVGVAAGGAALALGGCNPPHPHAPAALRAVSSLDCPDTQGDLTRKSLAADGKTCVYATESGDQVTLQVVSLTAGDARGALAPIEAQLKAEVPAAAAGGATAGSGATASTDGQDRDRVNIDLPGIHIHAHGDGAADIDTAGVHVQANGQGAGGGANVQVGSPGDRGVTVNAGEGGAQIHINEGGSGVRARFILASETAGPHGYRVAGYEARGPATGPIVVAQLLSKSDDQDDLRHDVHALIRRNVGGW
jgi:hypothetical protein